MCFRRLRAFLLKTRSLNQEKREFPIQIMRNPLLQNSSWVTFMFAILGENYSTTSKMCYAALDYGINLLQGCLESPLYFELYCLVCVQRPLCLVLLPLCSTAHHGCPWSIVWDTKSRGHLVLVLVVPAFECQRSCGWWIGAGAPTPECTRLSAQMENNWRAVKN